MDSLRFGINRMVAPSMGLVDFMDLAAEVGGRGVELRNDLPGFDVVDNFDPGEVRELLAERELEVLTINAVQHFNLSAALEEAKSELQRLIRIGAELGRPAIVLCPHNDRSDSRSGAEMARDTEAMLREYAPILEAEGVVGLVEPLGFPESSLRDPSLAVSIIGEIGSSAYRITLDTFHFAVAEQNQEDLGSAKVPADRIGIVHLSGVTKGGPVNSFRDPDRVYVNREDRCGNIESVERLVRAGYSGPFSFEPFSPTVHNLRPGELRSTIIDSMRLISNNI